MSIFSWRIFESGTTYHHVYTIAQLSELVAESVAAQKLSHDDINKVTHLVNAGKVENNDAATIYANFETKITKTNQSLS
jgi:response regulator RpfG family c-di-GMP phosphodiesterase